MRGLERKLYLHIVPLSLLICAGKAAYPGEGSLEVQLGLQGARMKKPAMRCWRPPWLEEEDDGEMGKASPGGANDRSRVEELGGSGGSLTDMSRDGELEGCLGLWILSAHHLLAVSQLPIISQVSTTSLTALFLTNINASPMQGKSC